VILAMLALLALIGVTFATFSGQARQASTTFAQSQDFPDSAEVMDFALSQLINDTFNPLSAIRGHSLLRDMYGNDASNNGFLATIPSSDAPIVITGVTQMSSGVYTGLYQITTNMVAGDPTLFGSYDFTRWILRFGPIAPGVLGQYTYGVAQTFEVIADDYYSNYPSGARVLYVTPNDPSDTLGNPPQVPSYLTPTIPTLGSSTASSVLADPLKVLASAPSALANLPITLDGRYLRAFNGPGLNYLLNPALMSYTYTDPLGNTVKTPVTANTYGNFGRNGPLVSNGLVNSPMGDPNSFGMDEDYDACDLDNWFMAIQSADGQTIIPSFHRPAIIRGNPQNPTQNDWTMTPAVAASNNLSPLVALDSMARILRPRKADGHSLITFPDLTPDPTTGRITYDVDNDGDGLTDSVWLDLGFPPKRGSTGILYKPLFAFMVIGLNGRLPLNTGGNLNARDSNTGAYTGAMTAVTTGTATPVPFAPLSLPSSRLGNSPSEVDITYALQNAFDPTMFTNIANSTPPAKSPYMQGNNYWQFDNAGVPVNLTQLRNLLTGTRPQDNPYLPTGLNGDGNFVFVNGTQYFLPNNVYDAGDVNNGNGGVNRFTLPVAGRWGEADYVPSIMTTTVPVNGTGIAATYIFTSPVGPGLSGNIAYGDNRDDNFNANDCYPNASTGVYPEQHDLLDAAGLHALPVERLRRFSTPIDVAGNGIVSTYNPTNKGPFAAGQPSHYGADNFGRVCFEGHFRPPGYATYWTNTNQQGLTSGGNQAPPVTVGSLSDYWTNPLHGFDALRNPYNLATSPPSPTPHSQTAAIPDNPPNNPWVLAWSRLPIVSPAPPNNPPTPPINIAAMPSNISSATGLPTFVSGGRLGFNDIASYYDLDNLNEPDEMKLYGTSAYDLPFTASDLEWLYRYQDTDGASLQSRLAQLAPISFLNAADGQRRRRLFALDSWETNNFVWANDNPPVATVMNANNVPVVVGAFPDNSRFDPLANASYANLNVTPTTVGNYAGSVGNHNYPFNYFSALENYYTNNNIATNGNSNFPANPNVGPNAPGQYPYSNNLNPPGGSPPNPPSTWPSETVDPTRQGVLNWTPQLAHRDKKINLNSPLPVSNDCNEPIRQKWIRDTYTTLKDILPPHAVDTPQELAQLSQFVINIIDFRDPDATMTRWVNPDVTVNVAKLTGTGQNPTAQTAPTIALAPNGTGNLEQFGMEYNPIAINEALAYSFGSKSTSSTGTVSTQVVNRFFIELVNTLSQSATPGTTATQGTNTTPNPNVMINPSDATSPRTGGLDLTNWELWIGEDNSLGRPDPITGQIGALVPSASTGAGLAAGSNYGPIPLSENAFVNYTTPTSLNNVPLVLMALTSAPTPYPAEPAYQPATGTGTPANYYHVIGNASANAGSENNPPSTTAMIGSNMQIETLINYKTAQSLSSVQGNIGQTDWFDDSTSTAQIGPYNLTPIPHPTTQGSTRYLWLYLRRPANPFLPGSSVNIAPGQPGYNPMVVVDSMRFLYTESGGVGSTGLMGDTVNPTGGSLNNIFSTQRYQPFRGGHAVAALPTTGISTSQTLIPAFGYSEQMVAPNFSGAGYSTNTGNFPKYGALNLTKNPIAHTLGRANEGSMTSGTIGGSGETWDYFVFNDRDFTSPAELMLVPGCPPGLFTKQFVENPPGTSIQQTPPTSNASFGAASASTFTNIGNGSVPLPILSPPPGTTLAATSIYTSPPLWTIPAANPTQPPNVYPYLIDNFFYTAASQQNLNRYPTLAPGATGTPPTNPGPWWPIVGGPTGAGWHKMFDFFEVPSPAYGAIAEVALGSNYDWARQDRRPGLLNLNLVVDEEVFLGLMGNAGQRNNFSYAAGLGAGGNLVNVSTVLNNNPAAPMVTTPVGFPVETGETGSGLVPKIVTMTDYAGAPYTLTSPTSLRLAAYPISNQGFIVDVNNPPNNGNAVPPTYYNTLKQCFCDFLKIRHGGSGYMFGWGTGQTMQVPDPLPNASSIYGTNGANNPNYVSTDYPIAAERPFRSLSYPDIDYTVMRPATTPPSLFSSPLITTFPANNNAPYPLASTTQPVPFVYDPGVKSPYRMTSTYVTPQIVLATASPTPLPPVYPSPIPPRRLFQIPDGYGSPGPINTTVTIAGNSYKLTNESNAGTNGDFPFLNTLINNGFLSNPNAVLTMGTNNNYFGQQKAFNAPTTSWYQFDNDQHPYYRSEWMQRIMNLTTVRTHQYAVWITVAFFEVTRQGDPMLANDPNFWQLSYDILGEEMNLASGRNVRYRSFFLVDRTQAAGFNQASPADFRNCVAYRSSIQ
jgi:hypothetical protein